MSEYIFGNDLFLRHIFKNCDQKTLSQAVRVSQLCYSVGMPILYKSPELTSKENFYKFLLTLHESFDQFSYWLPDTCLFVPKVDESLQNSNCIKDSVIINSSEKNTSHSNSDRDSDTANKKPKLNSNISSQNNYTNISNSVSKVHQNVAISDEDSPLKIPTYNKESFFDLSTEKSTIDTMYAKPLSSGWSLEYWPSITIYHKDPAPKTGKRQYFAVKRVENSNFLKENAIPSLLFKKDSSFSSRQEKSINFEISRKLIRLINLQNRATYRELTIGDLVQNLDLSQLNFRWNWLNPATLSCLLQYLTNLRLLDLTSCLIIHLNDLNKWAKLFGCKLHTLVLYDLNIEDDLFISITSSKLVNLQTLNASATFITDRALMKLTDSNLPRLEVIYLDSTSVRDLGISHLVDTFPNIKFISAEDTLISAMAEKVEEINRGYEWEDITDSSQDYLTDYETDSSFE
ncbi:hypothetical protein AYI68_g1870 [Smittium mucronatum]|uniref:Uncharacterized protein n=1 Tax=Smittium mucronatum TaxID=133383 RepID=A0A1R0H4E4_9FUNG|nr:hypothetical protein AYI68_g1870 [Smittium mucronatum]